MSLKHAINSKAQIKIKATPNINNDKKLEKYVSLSRQKSFLHVVWFKSTTEIF